MFVQQLSLKNFKSFKEANLVLTKGFNSFVGPNGGGKTNLVDALLFAFGETSLKSMRVKRTPDLIFSNHNIGEVTVTLSDSTGSGTHEVKRMVRKDGVTKYILDGKRVKKYVLEEFLSKNRLFTSNIIKQGQVQNIVEMNSKDRRTLVDNVANISEYESKKKEALNELDKVAEKLNAASAIFAERQGYIEELENEKRDAEKYIDLKKQVDRAKASMLYIDLTAHSGEFETIVSTMVEFEQKLSDVRRKIDSFASELSAKNTERQKIHEQILQRSQGKQLILQKEMDELNANVERSRTIIEEKKTVASKEDSRKSSLNIEKMKADDEVKGYSSQMNNLQKELDDVAKILKKEQDSLDKLLKESDVFTSEFHAARQFLENANSEIFSCKEQLTASQAEAAKQSEIKKLREAELDRLRSGTGVADLTASKKAISEKVSAASKVLNEIDGNLNKLYASEKGANKELSETEESLLRVRTRLAELESRIKTLKETDQTRATSFVTGLGLKGVYGTVEELCSFKDQYALAVQASLGGRANYLVVDSSRTVAKVIDELKKAKVGRAAFIPLDKIRPSPRGAEEAKLAKTPGCAGFLLDFVEFDRAYAKAFEYALGSTLLFDSLKEAEPVIGKIRIATLDGQIAEASGVMIGGSVSQKLSGARDRKELEDLYSQQTALQKAKDSVLNSLYSSRDAMVLRRKDRAKAELDLRALEIEFAALKAKEETLSTKKVGVSSAISQLEKEVEQCEELIRKADEDRSSFIRNLSDLNVRALEAKQKIDVEKDKNFGFAVREREKKVSDLKITVSDLSNQLESLKGQRSVYEKQSTALKKQLDECAAEINAAESAIEEHGASVGKCAKLLSEKTAEQRKLSSALKELYDRREEIETELQRVGTEKGKLEFERDKIEREVNSRNVRRAVVETQLTNLKAEFAQYELLEIPNKDKLRYEHKPELLAASRQLQGEIDTLGSVNLKAIELFAVKLAELDEQRSRVTQLSSEKEAVLKLIDQIEGKKIATFMQSFIAVNDNFKKLFKHVFRGNGELFLENPENPFLGGLTIKVQLENKEVKYLELMSGGEKSLVALMFLFAIQSFNPSSVYILDEADAALDQENSRKLALLIKQLSRDSQFVVVSHNQNVYREADCLAGVAMTQNGSALVEVKLNEPEAAAV